MIESRNEDRADTGHVSIAMPNLRASIMLWGIVACVAVCVVQVLGHQLGVVAIDTSYAVLGLSRESLPRGGVCQAVTAPYVHFGVEHLAFNLLALVFIGVEVEQCLGCLRYVLFSVSCVLAGSLGFLALSAPWAVCGGYSGVLYGVCAVAMTPGRRW